MEEWANRRPSLVVYGHGEKKSSRRSSKSSSSEPFVDPLAKLWRPSEKGRETGLKPAGGIAPSGFPAPAAVLARAAAAFGVKVTSQTPDLMDEMTVQMKTPEVRRKRPPSSNKDGRKERLSLTSWAANGFAGLLGQEITSVTGITRETEANEGPLSLNVVSKLRLKKRNAVDLRTRKPSVEHVEIVDAEDSQFVPLSIMERKPPTETWTISHQASRRSRKSSAKARPSALTVAKRGVWLQSFQRYLYDGEIHSDDLPKALLHSGFEDCRPHLIASALAKVAEYSTLDEDEFLNFMCQYEEDQQEDASDHFQKFAENGHVCFSSMTDLLSALELFPRRRVLVQIISEVAESEMKSLTFEEFQKTVQILRQRHCFLQEELEHFKNVFQVFDRDNSGGMTLAELSSALAWLGFPISGSLLSLHRHHDLDDTGALTEVEFLRCLRCLYEDEARVINENLKLLRNNRCQSGSELENLLHALGYTATVDILVDSLQVHNLCKGYVRNSQLLGMPFASVEFSLDLEDLRDLTCTIRTRDGFTDEEMEEMKMAFNMQSKSKEEISTPAIQKALRWLGHLYSFEMVQQLVTELDLDGDCMLDFTLFVKLIRKCRDRDRQEVANVFFSLDPLDLGTLDPSQQLQALQCLGISSELVPQLSEGIRLQQFLKIIQRIKFDPARLEHLREYDFFEPYELLELERYFRSFDKDGSGELRQQELVLLIEALFPRHANLPEFRPYFSELLTFADVNQNGRLDFKEFVRLIRKIRDHEEEFHFELYKETLQELGFSHKEAAEIHLFFSEAAENGRLSLEDVKEMIAGSFKLNEKERHKLLCICRTATETIGDGDSAINFLSFLHIMRKVLDVGWAFEP